MDDDLHDVTKAAHVGGHNIEVTFDDGTTGTFDLSKFVPFEGVFAPLVDEAEVAKLFVDCGTVCWPNSADLAPEVLYDHIKNIATSAA